MTRKDSHYESARVWNNDFQLGQKNLIKAISDYWPDDVGTVLDVGCGDGKLTEILAKQTGANFHGLDASYEALSRLSLPHTLGDIAQLPFSDNQFDMVMATDVLEHLSDDAEDAAWSEIFRVSAKWVLVAVPFREQLIEATTRCKRCHELYHVNWHQRSYDISDLVNKVRGPWSVAGIILSGESWSPISPHEINFRRCVLDEWSGWRESLCPKCGESGTDADAESTLDLEIASTLGRYIYSELSTNHHLRTHTEILVIFSCSDRKIKQGNHLTERQTRHPSAQLDMRNHLNLNLNLNSYPPVARAVSGGDNTILAQFPVYPEGDRIVFTRKCVLDEIEIIVEDGAGGLFCGRIFKDSELEYVLSVNRKIEPGYYGLIIRLPSKHGLISIEIPGSPSIVRLSSSDECTVYPVINTSYGEVFIQVDAPIEFDVSALDHGGATSTLSWVPFIRHLISNQKNANKELMKQQTALMSIEQSLALGQMDNYDQLAVAVQNMRGERDGLLERASEADCCAVEVQNLTAERDALLICSKNADQLAVTVQNLQAEREIFIERAKEADRLAVELQNLKAQFSSK